MINSLNKRRYFILYINFSRKYKIGWLSLRCKTTGKNHLRFKILLKKVQFYFFEQFADKGRPCSTRKQAYREYTATLLRIGAGGRRVGIQNEGVMRRWAAKGKGGGREGPAGVGVPLWDSRRWGERKRGSQPILYYTTLQ